MEERGWVKVLEDGAPQHTRNEARDWRKNNYFDIFPHPASSPDINAIENVWYLLKTRINGRPQRPRSEQELKVAILEEWERIPLSVINKIIDSMPDRYEHIIEAKGCAIKA